MDDDEQIHGAGPESTGRAEEPLTHGVEQFQRAALDAVRAARAMLDAAETMIKDPATMESVVRTAAGIARTATETVAGFAAGAASDPRPPGSLDDDVDDRGDDDAGGFESIRID